MDVYLERGAFALGEIIRLKVDVENNANESVEQLKVDLENVSRNLRLCSKLRNKY